MPDYLDHHKYLLRQYYISLAHIVRDRAIADGIHEVGPLVNAYPDERTLSKIVPRTRLHRLKHTTDNLYKYELYYFVRGIRFVIPFNVMFKKEAKPIAEALKKLCGIVYYQHYGSFFGDSEDELLY